MVCLQIWNLIQWLYKFISVVGSCDLCDFIWKLDLLYVRKVEDIKWVIRSRKSKDRQHSGQMKKDKQQFTKHYTEN